MLTVVQDIAQTAGLAPEALAGLIAALQPVIQGKVAVPVVDWLKQHSAWVDRQQPWLKQVIVLLTNGLLAAVGVALGTELPGFGQWTTATVMTVLGSALSLALHAGRKAAESAARADKAIQKLEQKE